jgi:hypothetical protein
MATCPSQLQSPMQGHRTGLGVGVGVRNRSWPGVDVGLAVCDGDGRTVAVAVGGEAVPVMEGVGVPTGGREPVAVGGTVCVTVGLADGVAVSVGTTVPDGVAVGPVTHVLLAVQENCCPSSMPLAQMVSVPAPPVPL